MKRRKGLEKRNLGLKIKAGEKKNRKHQASPHALQLLRICRRGGCRHREKGEMLGSSHIGPADFAQKGEGGGKE